MDVCIAGSVVPTDCINHRLRHLAPTRSIEAGNRIPVNSSTQRRKVAPSSGKESLVLCFHMLKRLQPRANQTMIGSFRNPRVL